jgi:hypothetical protein
MGAASPAWLISLAASVYEIDGFEATGDASRQEDALWTDPVVVTTLRGPGASPPVLLLESNLVKANAEKQRGAAIFLGVGANDRIVFVVSARPDSEIVFLGECTAPDSARLRAYVSSLVAAGEPVTAEDVFRAVVADPQGEVAADLDAFFTAPSPTGWENRDPDLRLLDPEETRAEILATLDHVAIEIDLPEGWREFPGTICTRASLAWNECTPFEVIPGEPLELLAYAVPGEDLEIWLLDDSATLADPLARLGVVPTDAIAEVVSAAGRPDASIRMHGDPSVAAYDELLSRSASGTPSILLDS